ncbi:hypothetical protein D3C87_824490 [compost metagenome]
MQLGEALKEQGDLVGGDANPGVLDFAEDLAWLLTCANDDVTAPRRRELEGVADEVVEDLPDARSVHGHQERFVGKADLDFEVGLAGLRHEAGDDLADLLAQVSDLLVDAEAPGFQAREVEQVVEQTFQALGALLLLVDVLQLLRRQGPADAVLKELRIPQDRGERRPKFMCDRVDEGGLEAVHLLEPLVLLLQLHFELLAVTDVLAKHRGDHLPLEGK